MRLIHTSDTHGRFNPLLGIWDYVVHSGDFCPNFNHGINLESYYQQEWLESKTEEIKNWIHGKPFLFCLGNHDYLSPGTFEKVLRAGGVEAYDLTDKTVLFDGMNFYGFPYVPPINGRYAYELGVPEMTERVDALISESEKNYIDIVVAHCPIGGCLDLDSHQNMRFGNQVMTTALDYKWDKNKLPQAYLCGHIHSAHGVTIRNGVLVSNAATYQNIISL
jgi:Icc-related predicted phosphoesterase